MSKRYSPQEKASIVMEFFSTRISTAELCRKYDVPPATFLDWKDKFLQGGKRALAGRGDTTKNQTKEMENLKQIIDEIKIAKNILKKSLRGAKRRR